MNEVTSSRPVRLRSESTTVAAPADAGKGSALMASWENPVKLVAVGARRAHLRLVNQVVVGRVVELFPAHLFDQPRRVGRCWSSQFQNPSLYGCQLFFDLFYAFHNDLYCEWLY